MSEPFIAEVKMWGCNFAPRNWAFCDGQLLPITSNTALFSIIGTIYGGDGRTTMGLPNLEDRVPMHQGRGPGLSSRRIGESGGSNQVVITEAELPSHDHIVSGVAEDGTSGLPDANLLMGQDNVSADEVISYTSTEAVFNAQLAPESVSSSGQNQAHENRQPFLGVNFCIALQGVFPSRS